MSDRDRGLVDGWRRMLPGWEFRAWTDETIDFSSDWLRKAYAMRAWNRVSDHVRMTALLRHGGVYLDTDVELRRPLDGLLGDGCFLGFQTDERSENWNYGDEWVNGAVFGAAPGHWFVAELLDWMTSHVDGHEERWGLTGPGAITAVLQKHGLPDYAPRVQRIRDLALYPVEYFYPLAYEGERPPRITADTHAIHHWSASWVGEAKRWPLSKKVMGRLAGAMPAVAYHLRRTQVELERRRIASSEKGSGT